MQIEHAVIKCPKCGREYLPAEIYIPTDFFGRPDIIKRDGDGEIVDFIGSSMDLTDKYQCDNCNTVFNVVASISFETSVDESVSTSDVVPSRFKLREF